MPKIVDYDKKKREIVDVALLVFSKKGYHNTNLIDISEKCSMGRTTIYSYFKNKDEIFQYVISIILERVKYHFRCVLELKGVSFIDKIKILVERLADEYKKSNFAVVLTDMRLITRRESNEVLEKLRESIHEIRTIFKTLLEEGIKQKEIKPIDKEKMSVILHSLVESFALHTSSSSSVDDRDGIYSIHLLIDGLKA